MEHEDGGEDRDVTPGELALHGKAAKRGTHDDDVARLLLDRGGMYDRARLFWKDVVDVTRSADTSRAMGYSYTIVYRHEDVGADQPLLGTDTTNLVGTGAQVDVVESLPGTQVYGSFQLRFEAAH